MRLVVLIFALVLAVLFAVQNTDVIGVSLLLWHVQASLAVIMVVCVVLGLLLGLLALVPRLYRGRKNALELERRVTELENGDARPVKPTIYPKEQPPEVAEDARDDLGHLWTQRPKSR